MAGSYNHCTLVIDGKRQFIGTELLDHLGDAYEALEEMWFLIGYLSNDSEAVIQDALGEYYRPSSDIARELSQRLKDSIDNDHWSEELEKRE